MSDAVTGRASKRNTTEPRTNWERIYSLTAAQIRAGIRKDPEICSTDEAFWAKAKIVGPALRK